VGVDLGQKRDHTVVSVIEKKNRQFELVHLKQFPLGTEYNQVLEYLKLVGERFQTVRGYYIDRTGVGEVFVENARKHGLKNVEGIVLTMQQKQEVMTCLKQVMLEKRLHIPRDKGERDERRDLGTDICWEDKVLSSIRDPRRPAMGSWAGCVWR
jgi:phage FluMu gp28-like protein